MNESTEMLYRAWPTLSSEFENLNEQIRKNLETAEKWFLWHMIWVPEQP